MLATFASKAQKQIYMKFMCKFFLDFPIQQAQQIRIVNLRIDLACWNRSILEQLVQNVM